MGSTGKRKLEMKMREKQEQRMVTFSKRRKGLFKKAHELHWLTGASTAVLAFSPGGRPFTHGDPSFEVTFDRYFLSLQGEIQDHNESPKGKPEMMRDWLKRIPVENYYNVEDLNLVKNLLEEIKFKATNQIDDEFVQSLFS